MSNKKYLSTIALLTLVISVSVVVTARRSYQSSGLTEPFVALLAFLPEEANTLEELNVALNNEEADLVRALDTASNDLERHQALLKQRNNRVWARKLLVKARSDPSDSMAVGALAMIVAHFPEISEGREATDLILKDHIQDESLESTFDPLVQSESELAVEILRAAYRSSPYPSVKVHAGFSLACLLKTRAERHGWRDLSRSQTETAEAETLFKESAAQRANIRVGQGVLAELARSQLEELRALSIGKVAPEIAGPDTDGQPLTLSDYRGRVVVLAFWGNWCSLCRSMFPYERSLVKRMQGRPFVLLGVNSDNGTTVAQSLTDDQTITWRSWRDGGELNGGKIARLWNVQYLPDIFILDDRGVIRHHVGPHPDDHGPVYLLDSQGQLQHRWQSRFEEVLEVAEALVKETEQGHPNENLRSDRKAGPGMPPGRDRRAFSLASDL